MVPNTTKLLFSNSILPKSYLRQLKMKKLAHVQDSVKKTSNEFLCASNYSLRALKDENTNKINIATTTLVV